MIPAFEITESLRKRYLVPDYPCFWARYHMRSGPAAGDGGSGVGSRGCSVAAHLPHPTWKWLARRIPGSPFLITCLRRLATPFAKAASLPTHQSPAGHPAYRYDCRIVVNKKKSENCFPLLMFSQRMQPWRLRLSGCCAMSKIQNLKAVLKL